MRDEALLVVLLCLIAVVTCVSGCAATQLERQATVASVTRVALNGTAGAIEIACSRERVESDPARLRKCSRAVLAHDAARESWDVWATAILLAVEDEDSALAVALALSGPAIEAYRAVAALLAELGVSMPEIPALGGGS